MRNIIKAQFYQLTKEVIPLFTFIGVTACSILISIFVDDNSYINDAPVSGGESFANNMIGFITFSMLFVAITVPLMCGNDFLDKTTNYELLSGHIRRDVFFGRAIPPIIVGTLGCVLSSTAPIIATTIRNGWGDDISIGDVAFRVFLLLFPVIRIICELIFLSFLLKNPYIVMALGWVGIMIGNMLVIGNMLGFTSSYFTLGFTTITKVITVDVWTTYGLEENVNLVFDTALPVSDIIISILSSVIISAACLYLGYIFFKKDDLN